MPTNRRYRARRSTLNSALLEWLRTEDAGQFFRGELEWDDIEDYHGPLRELLRPDISCCPIYHIWLCHLDGEDCGSPHHVADGRCARELARLLELHRQYQTARGHA